MLYFSRWKTILIWLIVLGSVALALPNVLSTSQREALPGWLSHNRLALGLDLQGGTEILLAVDRDDIVRERLEATVAGIGSALREAGITYTGLSGVGQEISVNVSDPARTGEARAALQELFEQAGEPGDVIIGEGEAGQLTFGITDRDIERHTAAALSEATAVLRQRIIEAGAAEPKITLPAGNRIRVEVPGVADPEQLKALVEQTAKLSLHLVDDSMPVQDAIANSPPAGSEILYSMEDPPEAFLVRKTAFVSGKDFADAQVAMANEAEQLVAFRFTADAAGRFTALTGDNVGKSLAFVLDDQVLSSAVIHEQITEDRGHLVADFSEEGARDLAIMLRSGPLPAKLTVLEERTIVPSLGSDSARAAVAAGIAGAALVVGFMLLAYGVLGAIASFAVTINVAMIIGLMGLFGLPLTLPGIAGIVLTIGMAVDANVLIYERIREECANGRPFVQSIGTGFSRAFPSILDANLTTLIAIVVLLNLGTGAVRGFAFTVAIGIATTLFTAFTLTYWLTAAWASRTRPTALPQGVRTGIFDGMNIRFMSLRRYSFAISAAVVIASMVGLGLFGMKLGIDFAGGSIIEVQAREGEADLVDIRERLSELNLGAIEVGPALSGPDAATIRVPTQEAGENAEQSAVIIIRDELEGGYEFRRVEVVGPSVSGELAAKAALGVAAALAAILIYIWFRFRWQFALGAIIATLHDVVITIGLFVLAGIEFNVASVAAVLTIIGYSLNDTVVVYDRVRENMKRFPRMPLPLLIDASINQTLSRTVLTSLTTVLALAALSVFGGEMIRSFAFVMLFGVAVATFSSIYMAAPMLIAFKLRPKRSAGDGGVGADKTKTVTAAV